MKGKDTRPELVVRRMLHGLGGRYRLHRQDLPGSPDIVMPSRKLDLFVHGCFWHRHENCKMASTPRTREDFWQTKFEANMARDRRNETSLKQLGWRVEVIWECETKQATRLFDRLKTLLASGDGQSESRE